MVKTAWQLAVVGAGPVGLALALHASRVLPHARITLFDARPAGRDLSADPRTLALSQGSVLFLQRLQAWPASQAEPITEVHVSQQSPGLLAPLGLPLIDWMLAIAGAVSAMYVPWIFDQLAFR